VGGNVDNGAAAKLDAIVTDFADLDPRERLELLLEFSEKLPPLPAEYEAQRAAGVNRVHECQTPVFLWVEVKDGLVEIHGDVPPESPTVRGFVSILQDAFSGMPPEDVLASCSSNLVQRLGLVEALGMLRVRGLHAILHYIRERLRRSAAN